MMRHAKMRCSRIFCAVLPVHCSIAIGTKRVLNECTLAVKGGVICVCILFTLVINLRFRSSACAPARCHLIKAVTLLRCIHLQIIMFTFLHCSYMAALRVLLRYMPVAVVAMVVPEKLIYRRPSAKKALLHINE